MPPTTIPRTQPIETKPRRHEIPEDFGYRTRRCLRCDAWISRYHKAKDGICYPCKPKAKREESAAEIMAQAPDPA